MTRDSSVARSAADRLLDLQRRIARAAAATRRDAITVVGASKGQTAATIRAAAVLGLTAVGENYVQEALGKQPALTDLALQWHFIGPLQANKTRAIACHFDWVQSVDRDRVAERLNGQRPSDLPPLNVLIQVNCFAEATKSGVNGDDVGKLIDTVTSLPRLRLRGFMALPPPQIEIARQRAQFAVIARLFARYAGRDFDTLSMGTSDDFESAIAEGATMIRIGTALFGPRSRHDAAQ